ncbi:MAG: hypothetical protein AAF919_04855 [Pseudomonadota bacterium]
MTLMVLDAQGIADGALPVAELAAQMRLADDYDTVPGQAERLRLRLRAAISSVERQTGKALIARDFILSGQSSTADRIGLPLAPVAEVHTVRLLRTTGSEDVAVAGLETDTHRPVVALKGLITQGERIEIAVRAGFGDWSAVPDGLAQAVLLIAEGIDQGEGPMLTPTAAQLLAPWKVRRIGGGGV